MEAQSQMKRVKMRLTEQRLDSVLFLIGRKVSRELHLYAFHIRRENRTKQSVQA